MRENVQNFVKFFWHGSQNCFLCVQRTFLKKNFSFSKSLQNSKISDVFRLWGKHFGFLAKIILLGCQNCFQVSSGYFWKTFFENKFLELFIYFWSSGTIFLDFRRKFCDWFVKTAFYVYSGDFWLDCVFYKNLRVFSPSPGCEENILAFWRKNFKTFVKTALFRYKKF